MRHKLFLLVLLLFTAMYGWSNTDIYYVQFRDKANTIYNVNRPHEFLSQRAINRRNRWNIAMDSTDFPVNSWYVDSLRLAGARVTQTSRWLNGALIECQSATVVDSVRHYGFVTYMEKVYEGKNNLVHHKKMVQTNNTPQLYGDSHTQLQMLGVDQLHGAGFRGNSIHIAVIDAGFDNVNQNAAFDSLRQSGRLLGTRDFVDPTSNIYNEDSHGAVVLSTMAANIPNQYIGGAPDASYWLLRSEEAAWEWPIEADYWVAAAEFADSVGVDIISSSLGYAMFDDPNYDFQYHDLDGRKLRISRAALMSARKGIVTLISAGNDGANDWGTISAPADADSILTVGAVNRLGQYASFSSTGPSADGRVKPDICAVGLAAAAVNCFGGVYSTNGTSLSCPIAASMMACLMQAIPTMHPQQLIQLVRQSSSSYDNPDVFYGYGIPNAWSIYAQQVQTKETKDSRNWTIYPNPTDSLIYIDVDQPVWIQINDLFGRHHMHTLLEPHTALNLSELTQGVYLITVDDGSQSMVFRIVKN